MALQLSIDQPNVLRHGMDGYDYFYKLLVLQKADKTTLKGHNFNLKINPDRTIEVSSQGLPARKPGQGTAGTPVPTRGAPAGPAVRKEDTPAHFGALLEMDLG